MSGILLGGLGGPDLLLEGLGEWGVEVKAEPTGAGAGGGVILPIFEPQIILATCEMLLAFGIITKAEFEQTKKAIQEPFFRAKLKKIVQKETFMKFAEELKRLLKLHRKMRLLEKMEQFERLEAKLDMIDMVFSTDKEE